MESEAAQGEDRQPVQGLLLWRAARLLRGIQPWKLVLGAVVVAVLILARYLQSRGILELGAVIAFIQVYPVAAPILFAMFYAVFCSLVLPTLPLNIAAGFLWGTWLGGIYASVGSVLGAIAAFIIARALLGQPLQQRFETRLLGWLETQLRVHGWKVVAFVRLNPAFPGPVNFIFGLTGIRLSTYIWASSLFVLPPTFFFAYTGQAVGDLALEGRVPDLALNAVIFSLGLITMVALAVVTRIGLRRSGARREQ